MKKSFLGFDVTDDEVSIIRYLAERYKNPDLRHLSCGEFCKDFNIQGNSQQEFWKRILPMEHLKIFESSSVASISISPNVLLAVKAFDAPPPKRDYLDEWTSWARGSKAICALFVATFTLPLVWSWVQMIQGLIDWFALR